MKLRSKNAKHATQCNNTEICYTYCDASNYKVHNTVVVTGNLTRTEIEQILSNRYEGEFFIPAQVGLPENRFNAYRKQDDHIWFILPDDAFSPTNQKPTISITAAELLAKFKLVDGNWDEIAAWCRLAGELPYGAEDENWYKDDCKAVDVENDDLDGDYRAEMMRGEDACELSLRDGRAAYEAEVRSWMTGGED